MEVRTLELKAWRALGCALRLGEAVANREPSCSRIMKLLLRSQKQYVHVYIYTQKCNNVCIYACIYIDIYIYIYVYICNMSMCMYTNILICTHENTHMYTYISIYICIDMCIHIHVIYGTLAET